MRPDTASSESGREALVRLVRDEGSRVLATLVRTSGSLEVAEDAVQDAAMTALRTWPLTGIPVEPRAWLTKVARNRAIDILRRESQRFDKESSAELIMAIRETYVPDVRTPTTISSVSSSPAVILPLLWRLRRRLPFTPCAVLRLPKSAVRCSCPRRPWPND